MNKFKLAIISLAAGVLAAGTSHAAPVAKAAADAAQPQAAGIVQVRDHGGGRHFHGRHHFRGGGFHHHRHFRHHRFWGPRVYFYGGRGGCYWLKERALDTGSRYWWRRYHACRNGW